MPYARRSRRRRAEPRTSQIVSVLPGSTGRTGVLARRVSLHSRLYPGVSMRLPVVVPQIHTLISQRPYHAKLVQTTHSIHLTPIAKTFPRAGVHPDRTTHLHNAIYVRRASSGRVDNAATVRQARSRTCPARSTRVCVLRASLGRTLVPARALARRARRGRLRLTDRHRLKTASVTLDRLARTVARVCCARWVSTR